MRNPRDIIFEPIVSEKSYDLIEESNTYTFRVDPRSHKTEIKQAVEQLFKAKVASVRTSSAHGKTKRQGRFVGQRPDWKKAYVRLRDGEKMPEFLEGA